MGNWEAFVDLFSLESVLKNQPAIAPRLLINKWTEMHQCKHLQPMILAMLGTIATVLNEGEEVAAQEALELFIEVAEAHPRFLRHQLGEVLTAMLQAGVLLC